MIVIGLARVDGPVFDLDGVITRPASARPDLRRDRIEPRAVRGANPRVTVGIAGEVRIVA